MANLTEDDLKDIIRRASILQKYHHQSLSQKSSFTEEPESVVYEISDSLGIERHFVKEALIEFEGIPIEEPVSVDTQSLHKIEIQGFANGMLESSLLNELRSHIEYEFNTLGSIIRRKGNIYWKASPSFPAKLFEISSSPEIEFAERNGRVKITLRQSLKTLNKLFAFPIAASLGAFMLFAAAIYEVGGESAPFIVSGIMLTIFSILFSGFVQNRKSKRKQKAKDLVETLQQIMERRFRAGRFQKEQKPEISLQDFDDLSNELNDIDIKTEKKVNS